jgi:hypothetical protein
MGQSTPFAVGMKSMDAVHGRLNMKSSFTVTRMLSAFEYRLYPRPEQEMRLDRSLLLLCSLYNDLKAEAMRKYRGAQVDIQDDSDD